MTKSFAFRRLGEVERLGRISMTVVVEGNEKWL